MNTVAYGWVLFVYFGGLFVWPTFYAILDKSDLRRILLRRVFIGQALAVVVAFSIVNFVEHDFGYQLMYFAGLTSLFLNTLALLRRA